MAKWSSLGCRFSRVQIRSGHNLGMFSSVVMFCIRPCNWFASSKLGFLSCLFAILSLFVSHNGDYWATSNSSIRDGPLEKLWG